MTPGRATKPKIKNPKTKKERSHERSVWSTSFIYLILTVLTLVMAFSLKMIVTGSFSDTPSGATSIKAGR